MFYELTSENAGTGGAAQDTTRITGLKRRLSGTWIYFTAPNMQKQEM